MARDSITGPVHRRTVSFGGKNTWVTDPHTVALLYDKIKTLDGKPSYQDFATNSWTISRL